MAEDLRRYLEGRPIAARPLGLAGRLWRWCRRNPKVASLAAALLLTFALGTPSLLALWLQAHSDRARAETEAANAGALVQFLSEDMLSQAVSHNQFGSSARPDPDIKVRTALDRAAAKIGDRFNRQPEVEALIRKTIGETYQLLGLYTQARPHLKASLELRRRRLEPTITTPWRPKSTSPCLISTTASSKRRNRCSTMRSNRSAAAGGRIIPLP